MPNGSASDLPFLILRLPSADAVPGAEALLTPSASVRIMEDPAKAEAELAAGSSARLAVICPAPEAWMALALAAGEAPTQAVRSWRDSVRPLMALLRARRRQTVLLFEKTFAADPVGCAASLGLPPPEGPAPLRHTDDPVLIMIARQALRDDSAAQALAEELAATALSPADIETAPDQGLDVIFHSYVEGLRRQAAAEAGRDAATAQVAALAVDVALLQEQVRTGTEQAEAAQAQAAARLATAETEAGVLREQVRLEAAALEMQAALVAEQARAASHEAGRDATTAQVAALAADVALLQEQVRTGTEQAEAAQAQAAARLATAETEAGVLREQVRLEAAALEEMQAALVAEQARAASLEAGRDAATAQAAALAADVALLQEQVRTGTEQAEAAEATLAAERSRAEAAQAQAAARLAVADTEAGLLREQIRLEAAALEEIQAALVAEQAKAASLEAGQDAAAAQVKSLIMAERDACDAQAKTESELGEMIRQLREQVHQMGQGLESYHAQMESLRTERADLQAQIGQLQDSRQDLEGYYDHARQFSEQVDVLTADLGGLQSALQTAQAEAAERAQHVAWLQDEISRIHHSRSYRLTMPLRKLRKTIG